MIRVYILKCFLSEQARSRCDFSTPIHDQYLIYTDKVLDAFTETTCQQACTQERDFNCRSYSYLAETREGTPQCLLSGDTQKSAGSKRERETEY